ncbi:hypothetical protein HCH_06068 [Hahella chejuensis KCTC 2396]|uniref:Uncharacterized protein n=1 Tax=Hahella chejuensis (strain KCTC 2396) TaxID=349521 RepID=Q2S9F7_HAHCH|nr:hypothetical protein HCH_06068 [Hahella chejuensis KCTC 2396]
MSLSYLPLKQYHPLLHHGLNDVAKPFVDKGKNNDYPGYRRAGIHYQPGF